MLQLQTKKGQGKTKFFAYRTSQKNQLFTMLDGLFIAALLMV
jgi:hypothetical protein